MDLVRPGEPGYDDTRALFNVMIDKRPAVIARCATPDDVGDALALARAERYDVAVRAGGHSVAGMSTNDGGLVVDVRPMKEISIDATARRARVGAGVIWGEFDRAAQEHGLAVTGGRVSTTGVAGFTLGGGSGWLERAQGLACDNLRSVELVTADGRAVTASATENPDLFWGLHGGGGNFGVATAFEFDVHPVGPEVIAGLMLFPGDAALDVTRRYRDVAFDAPDELGSGIVMLTGPPEPFVPDHLVGTTCAAVAALWTGNHADAGDVLAPFRELAPAVDLVGPMPYADFQCMIDDPPGFRHYWSGDYHDSFPDDAIDVFVKSGSERVGAMAQQLMLAWGGAVARVPADASPLTKRDAKWITHPFAVWEDPADTEASIAWARNFRRDIGRFANGGVYLNFIGDEGQDRVRAAFGAENYARLAALKAEWDPGNVFRGNQNFEPAG